MGQMEFDFTTAREEKHQIEEIANRMNVEVLSGFLEVMQEILESWGGEAGADFLKIAGREAEQIGQTIQLLKYADTCVQDAIFTAEQTEEKVKEIAELRIY